MATKKSFIPKGFAAFNEWQGNFVTSVNLFRPGWNWPPTVEDEWKLLTDTSGKKKLRWDIIAAIIVTNNFKPSDEVEMQKSRKDYEFGNRADNADTSLRIFTTRYIRNSPFVTEEQKRIIGILVPDLIKTPTTDTNVKITGIELVGAMKKTQHLIHTILVTTPGSESRALGDGVDGIEVFMAITESSQTTAPPLTQFQLVGEIKRGLYTHTFDVDKVGKLAWYYVRKRLKGKTTTYGPPSLIWSWPII
jgi:hypothetical protein